MAEDYPDGDMTLEGVFRLAVRQLEKRDFNTAVQVLERARSLEKPERKKPRIEELGREQYFLARARIESGEVERGLAEYEQLIRDYPLSYYMLHAFTRLHTADSSRAQALLAAAQQRAAAEPFIFDLPRSLDQARFNRALELLRVGDIEAASPELSFLGLDKAEVAPRVLWGTALLYQRAGAARASSQTARLLQPEWLQRWPTDEWSKAWQLAYPRPYERIVSQEATKSGVAESLIYAVMREESAFDPAAVSPANAYGLMQLIEPTARHYAKESGIPANPRALLLPWVNIALGSRVLAKFSGMFPDNSLLAVPGYNAGPGRPKQWLKELGSTDFDVWVELIPFRETRHYTKRVLASRATYDYLYETQSPQALLLPLKLN
jgi:soluble lytic murein transglycosylase